MKSKKSPKPTLKLKDLTPRKDAKGGATTAAIKVRADSASGVTVNKAKTADKAYAQLDAYIKG